MLTEREIHALENDLTDCVKVLLCRDWRELQAQVAALKSESAERLHQIVIWKEGHAENFEDLKKAQAQVADLRRQAQNQYVNRGAIDGTSDARLVAQVATLEAHLSMKFDECEEAQMQVAALQANLAQALTALDADLTRIQALTAERDAAIKAACELFAFDEDSHKHWAEYTPATREWMVRQTDAAIAAALVAARVAEQEATAQVDEMELLHLCGKCGHELELVRPGKWQCHTCENK